jgi:hypothetical protein
MPAEPALFSPMSGEGPGGGGTDRFLMLVVFLVAAQSVLRIVFFVASFSYDFVEEEVSDEALMITSALFLVLGVAGLVFLYPLVKRRRTGYLGTVSVCIATIAFDSWGMLAIQSSAAMGMAVPVIAIVYLVLRRDLFVDPTSAGHAG